MARRRAGKGKLSRLSPENVAELVVSAYVKKFKEEGTNWVSNYTKNVTAYVNDPDRQAKAEEKLATWYSVLLKIIPKIKQAYEEAVIEYKQRMIAKAPAPAVEVTPATAVATAVARERY